MICNGVKKVNISHNSIHYNSDCNQSDNSSYDRCGEDRVVHEQEIILIWANGKDG